MCHISVQAKTHIMKAKRRSSIPQISIPMYMHVSLAVSTLPGTIVGRYTRSQGGLRVNVYNAMDKVHSRFIRPLSTPEDIYFYP